MITSVLVANRAEIACRVFGTCRSLGLDTVAVYSDADASALHVREADAAVRLPGAAPRDTYLRGDLIVRAALAAGADAVHPGYGFLSENAGFARSVIDAGLLWIGPPPEAIEAMASKTRAKELMAAAGVPLLSPVDPASATAADLPLLLKAAAGGGGRGMRVVRDLAALPGELAAASAEARSAFGDGEVFAEPYIERGRHVEVQVLADAHGTVWALGTRDCSLQRRHQKVIEEAPAPGLGPELRETLHASAVACARAVGYVGAGTVEFLVAGGRAYFLEMNTRLQVEHPVTEAVFGLDLVAWQLRVAEGAPLPPEPPEARGHAVEARLYAEDPSRGWAPQTGVLHALDLPARPPLYVGDRVPHAPSRPALRAGGTGLGPVPGAGGTGLGPAPGAGGDSGGSYAGGGYLRVDAGYAAGDTVGVHYDAMLAKVIAWAPSRGEAVRRLAHALARGTVHGPVTNRELLVRSLRHPDFVAGRLDTGFYERHLPALTEPAPGEGCAAVAAALAAAARRAGRFGGFRNVPSQPQAARYGDHEVRYRPTRDGGYAVESHPHARVVDVSPDRVRLDVDGVVRRYDVAEYGDGTVHVNAYRLTARPRFTDPAELTAPGSLLAPMPGTVVRVADVEPGARVEAGQPLVWLEAMKMEHRIAAPASGTLTALHAAPGHQVEVGALLAVVREVQEDEHDRE